MDLLLTGATGFVGRHVAGELAGAGHSLRCLVRDPARAAHLAEAGHELVQGHLLDSETLVAACEDVDAVVHVAGVVKARSFAAFCRVNAEGTAHLARASLAAGRPGLRFVLVSSQAAAGPSLPGTSRVESDPPNPVSWYGWSKLRGERAARKLLGDALVVVRPPAVYGPHDREILEFFVAARKGVRLRVGTRRRDISLVHVEDLARGIRAALEAPQAAGGCYYLANAEPQELSGLLGGIGRAVGRPGVPVRVPEPVVQALGAVAEELARVAGRVPTFSRDKAREFLAPGWVCDPALARRDLDWEARIPVEEGLAATAAWYREHGWL